MKTKFSNFFLYLISIIFLFIVVACEDSVPRDYVPEIVVEALLIVGEPIQNIRIIRTQSLFEPFVYDSSLVKDARITIYEGENVFNLVYKHSDTIGKAGYFYSDVDTEYLVEKLTTYKLYVELADGRIITGATTTPDSIYWVRRVGKYLQYPVDTLHLPPTDSIAWDGGAVPYIISITCLDTLNYGIYLENPNPHELNRHTYPEIQNEKAYRETCVMSFIPTKKTPVVWNFLKWFGKHETAIWLPDKNYLSWFLQNSWTANLEKKFSSVAGDAYGFFGSAFVIRDTSLVLKNRP